MKTYSVTYNTTTSYESIVKAKSKKDAEQKVLEVVGDPIVFESTREVHDNA